MKTPRKETRGIWISYLRASITVATKGAVNRERGYDHRVYRNGDGRRCGILPQVVMTCGALSLGKLVALFNVNNEHTLERAR